jgi:hypothetical protein
MDLLASARGSGPVDSLRWGQALTRVSRLTEIPVEDLNRRFRNIKPKPAGIKQPPAPLVENQEPNGNEPTAEVPLSIKRRGPLTASDQSERWILAVLLAEPHRWHAVQNVVGVNDFKDEAHRRLAEVYWNHQRDEGEPVFSEFLSSLPSPVLAELAVNLIGEFEAMNEPAKRLKDALGFLEDQKKRDQEAKQLAALKRTSVSSTGENVPGDDDMLRKIQETARRTDLRRTGS